MAPILKNHPKIKLMSKGLFTFRERETKGGAIRSTNTTKTPASDTEEVTVIARSEKKKSSLKNPLNFG